MDRDLKPNTLRSLAGAFLGFVFVMAIVAMLTILVGPASGADAVYRHFDREQLQKTTGTATVNSATANYANWQPLITLTPDPNHSLADVVLVLDLNQATTGFGAVYTSATINVTWARKVDGTNWRFETNKATGTISGTTAGAATGGLAVELTTPEAAPGEILACSIVISSVNATNVTIPFVVYYKAGAKATITAAN